MVDEAWSGRKLEWNSSSENESALHRESKPMSKVQRESAKNKGKKPDGPI